MESSLQVILFRNLSAFDLVARKINFYKRLILKISKFILNKGVGIIMKNITKIIL